jgi:hypothetical protein
MAVKKSLKQKDVKPVKPLKNEEMPVPFQKALPGLGITKDKLLLSLHLYEQSIVLQTHDLRDKAKAYRLIDAHDIANVLAGSLTFGTGILPGDEKSLNALWWSNSKNGPVTALWYPPGLRRLAVAKEKVEPERYNIPLPGLIFLCRPGTPPWVYAVGRRPTGPKEKIYKAPFPNVYDAGNTCPGSQTYGQDIKTTPELFLNSFFTGALDQQRTRKYKGELLKMWRELEKKKAKEYPLSDLYYQGTLQDLMGMRI